MSATKQHHEVVVILIMAMIMRSCDSAALVAPVCDRDSYYDWNADICTLCSDICDPARETPHQCDLHLDQCLDVKNSYLATSSPHPLTSSLSAQTINNVDTILLAITVFCVAICIVIVILFIVCCCCCRSQLADCMVDVQDRCNSCRIAKRQVTRNIHPVTPAMLRESKDQIYVHGVNQASDDRNILLQQYAQPSQEGGQQC